MSLKPVWKEKSKLFKNKRNLVSRRKFNIEIGNCVCVCVRGDINDKGTFKLWNGF